MRFFPQSNEDIQKMLKVMGLNQLHELFDTIPTELITKETLNLPDAMDEHQIINHFKQLIQKDKIPHYSFLGAGVYDHISPKLIAQIINRSEFLTSYTPYQPELSQGHLAAAFEYQTYFAEILNMDLVNASMYDVAQASAEAVLMASRIKPKANTIVLSEALNPNITNTIQTYLAPRNFKIHTLPTINAQTDFSSLKELNPKDIILCLIQSPNVFGVIEDLEIISKFASSSGFLWAAACTEAFAYAILEPPGTFNADFALADGNSLGLGLAFGGPSLGIFATKNEHTRQLPGRIVSKTTDANGKPSFTLTLATREQHIRREKATSNICTNHALTALAATICISAFGPNNFKNIALDCYNKANYLQTKLQKINKISLPYPSPTFNEFTIQLPTTTSQFLNYAHEHNIIPGFDLINFFPNIKNQLLIAVTEKNTLQQCDDFVELIYNYTKKH